jgi:DNA-directed RNA polymerase II subunit RPB2
MIGCAANGVLQPPSEAVAGLSATLRLDAAKLHAFLEVYGYWLGDGSLQFRAGCGTDAVVFCIVKSADIGWLLPTLELLTPHVRRWGLSDYMKRVAITDPAWVRLFHDLYREKYALGDITLKRPSTVTARKAKPSGHVKRSCIGVKSAKWLAPWAWEVDRDGARAILRGLRRADGCEKSDVNRIYTSSASFRDELIHLCMHAGYAPRFGKMYEAGAVRGQPPSASRPIVANHASWYVYYSDGGARAGSSSHPLVRGATDVTRVERTVRTWCVSVPRGFIVTRRARADPGTGEVVQASAPVVVHNCVISHGASSVLRERLFDQSDPFVATVCGRCGLLCQPAAEGAQVRNTNPMCKGCGTGEHVTAIHLPFAFKLLCQECYCLGIALRLRVDHRSSAEGAVQV